MVLNRKGGRSGFEASRRSWFSAVCIVLEVMGRWRNFVIPATIGVYKSAFKYSFLSTVACGEIVVSPSARQNDSTFVFGTGCRHTHSSPRRRHLTHTGPPRSRTHLTWAWVRYTFLRSKADGRLTLCFWQGLHAVIRCPTYGTMNGGASSLTEAIL